jgi:hypothetical protein
LGRRLNTDVRAIAIGELWWPEPGATKLHPIAAHELSVLLYSGNPATAHFAEPWRKIG